MKKKFIFLLVLIALVAGTKYFLWHYPVSQGKRVGNLTKISKKGKIFRTWEGTIDEGSGDKLTTYFSVRDNRLGQELYNYKGRQVILYYKQYYFGWPRETNYDVVSWRPKEQRTNNPQFSNSPENGVNPQILVDDVNKTLFCSFLGALHRNGELYAQVKEYIKGNNLYLYKQFSRCN